MPPLAACFLVLATAALAFPKHHTKVKILTAKAASALMTAFRLVIFEEVIP